jgi:uncharacterized protein (TIGR01777 family)
MKVFMTGGTGFVGTTLLNSLVSRGFEVTVLSRSARGDRIMPEGASLMKGDPAEKGPWQDRLCDHEIVINLAGASIFTRWTDSAKKNIRESRILTTRNLVEALSGRRGAETIFMSTSAVGYYGFHQDEQLDENTIPGEGFLASLACDWEAEAQKACDLGARVLLCRFGIVLGLKGGALGKMLPLFRWGLGSPLGSGRQWFPWIHEEDLVSIYLFLIDQKDLSGPVNCTGPYPVTNKEMTLALGQALGKPTFMPPIPGFMIKVLMGEFGSVLLNSQRVLPMKLLQKGFRFRFPYISDALGNLVGRR